MFCLFDGLLAGTLFGSRFQPHRHSLIITMRQKLSLSNSLVEARKARGLLQAQLAAILGKPLSYAAKVVLCGGVWLFWNYSRGRGSCSMCRLLC